MPSTHQFNITLPKEMAEQVERQVESGAYANVSEVVREGIELLLDREIPLEKWLREEVLESMMEYEADPTSAIPANQIMDRVRATAYVMRSASRHKNAKR